MTLAVITIADFCYTFGKNVSYSDLDQRKSGWFLLLWKTDGHIHFTLLDKANDVIHHLHPDVEGKHNYESIPWKRYSQIFGRHRLMVALETGSEPVGDPNQFASKWTSQYHGLSFCCDVLGIEDEFYRAIDIDILNDCLTEQNMKGHLVGEAPVTAAPVQNDPVAKSSKSHKNQIAVASVANLTYYSWQLYKNEASLLGQ